MGVKFYYKTNKSLTECPVTKTYFKIHGPVMIF